MIKNISLQKVHFAITLTLCFALFFTITYESKKYNINEDIRINPDKRTQNFISLVYISSSECPVCNNEENKENVSNVKNKFENVADRLGLDLYTVGVAKENGPYKGIRHLNRTGLYDEIISGMGPYNTAYQKYVWNDPIEPGTPQILIFEVSYFNEPKGKYIGNVSADYNLLMEVHGFAEIDSLSSVEVKDIVDHVDGKIR